MKQPVNLSFLRREIESQPGVLTGLLSSFQIERARDGSLLVGAGDSIAACMTVSSLSSLRLLSMDPRSLMSTPGAASGRDVYFVSVSGRTAANVQAAGRIRRFARRSIAITADPASPLSRETDEVILLPFQVGGKAPGLLSFSLALLVLSLLEDEATSLDFRRLLARSQRAAAKVSLSQSGVSYFLGNGGFHGIGIYAAAKVREFLGWRAGAELLEEFSHMELFSLSPRDSVTIFSESRDDQTGYKLAKHLARKGYSSRVIPFDGASTIEALFHATFAAQTAALNQAESSGRSHPYFLGAKKLLEISDAAIY